MTNNIALGLGLIILLLVASDVVFNNSQNLIFLGSKLNELIEWLAFWR
ncbi:MAG: hypothetical protein JKY94_15425 [Rhodobacteraceae bacterium]|nr:hypothetical protein [Paracoccaceae bacterium]